MVPKLEGVAAAAAAFAIHFACCGKPQPRALAECFTHLLRALGVLQYEQPSPYSNSEQILTVACDCTQITACFFASLSAAPVEQGSR